MSNGIQIPHPLKREGTYQSERFPEALNNDYVKLDERTLTDLVKQSAEYAKYVKYCNELNIEDGNWQVFFEEIYDYSNKKVKFSSIQELEAKSTISPHLALFLAFLKIFHIAQENLNTLTQKHLDFYYKNILQLKPLTEVADKAIVLFEPEKNADQVMVEAGTKLLAGKDTNGNPLNYITNDDLIVNKATVKSIKSIHLSKDNTSKIRGIYASDDATIDNLTLENGISAGWKAFGPDSNKSKKATIGFALASPILNLKEGKRRISIEFNLITSIDLIKSIDSNYLKVEYTSEKGWTEAILEKNTTQINKKNKPFYLLVKIEPGQPSVLPYNEDIHKSTLNTSHPVIRFILRNEENVIHDAYTALNSLNSETIKKLTVQVSGLKNLTIQNELGTIDNTKSFLPFGSKPEKNKSTLYIGNNDVFNKYLTSFNIALSWKGLPGRIDKYYKTYHDALSSLFPDNLLDRKKYFDIHQFDRFTPGHPPGKVSILDNGKWKQLKLNKGNDYATDVRYDPAKDLNLQRKDNRNIFVMSALEEELISNFSYDNPKLFNHNLKSGFIKLELGYDFGHSKFSKLFAVAMLNMGGAFKSNYAIPEQPYTPEFNSLHLEYTSSAKIDYSENQIFQIHPFGNKKLTQNDSLIPTYDNEGELIIGLQNIPSAETVSLYFHMENYSGNFDKIISDENKPNWSYLCNDEWKSFKKTDILKDTTNKFSGSGIIKFNLSSDAITTHSLMPNEHVWIKASVPSDSDAFPYLDTISAQAVEAVFCNTNNETSHLENGIPENTITKPDIKILGIKKINQPYPSYGGIAKEENRTFYTRISERLRHKNRSWNIWDFERIILEKFPSILKVKCIPHANPEFDYSPGNVYIIVIPDILKINQKNILQPRLSKSIIEEVKQFISKYTSPFVNIYINNPTYEEISVICDVKLAVGYDDKSYYEKQLNEDIKSFIAPWINKKDAIPSFGGTIYKSQIINYIEERPYIDYITTCEIKKNNTLCSYDAIRGSYEYMIITSSPIHNISTEGLC